MPRRATEDRNHSAHHDPAPRNTVVRSPPMLLRSSNDCRHCPLTVIFPEVDSRLPLLIRAFSELPVIRPQHLNCNTKTQAKTGRHRRTYRPESGHKGALAGAHTKRATSARCGTVTRGVLRPCRGRDPPRGGQLRGARWCRMSSGRPKGAIA